MLTTPNGATVTLDSEVRADALGVIWRSWFSTALKSVNTIMSTINARQSDHRRRALAILQSCRMLQRSSAGTYTGGRSGKKPRSGGTKLSQGMEALGKVMSFRRGGAPSTDGAPSTGGSTAYTVEGETAKAIWHDMKSPRNAASRRSKTRRSSAYLSPSAAAARGSRRSSADDALVCAPDFGVEPKQTAPWTDGRKAPSCVVRCEVNLTDGVDEATTASTPIEAVRVAPIPPDFHASTPNVLVVREGPPLDLSMPGLSDKTSTGSSLGPSTPSNTSREGCNDTNTDTPPSNQGSMPSDGGLVGAGETAHSRGERWSSSCGSQGDEQRSTRASSRVSKMLDVAISKALNFGGTRDHQHATAHRSEGRYDVPL